MLWALLKGEARKRILAATMREEDRERFRKAFKEIVTNKEPGEEYGSLADRVVTTMWEEFKLVLMERLKL